MTDGQRRLAKKLSKTGQDSLRIVRGVVISISGSTATVTIRGEDVAGVPFYAHVSGLVSGSKVDVLLDGETPVILGRLT